MDLGVFTVQLPRLQIRDGSRTQGCPSSHERRDSEKELAAKLLNGGLDKTEIAHQLAKDLEARA